MKKILVIALVFSIGLSAKNYESKVKEVEIFLNKAKVIREANIKLSNGVNDIIVLNIPNSIDISSLMVNSKAGYLLNISPKKEKRINEGELKILKNKLKEIKNKLSKLYAKRKNLDSRLVYSYELSLSTEIIKTYEYFERRLDKVKIEIEKTEKQKKIIADKIQKIENLSYYVYNISLKIKSNEIKNSKIIISYIQNKVQWEPNYTLYAYDEGINISYKARILQNSGENWKNVKVKIIPYKPTNEKYLELKPWILYPKPSNDMVLRENVSLEKEGIYYKTAITKSINKRKVILPKLSNVNINPSSDFSEIVYEIKEKISIKNGEIQLINIINYNDIKGEYSYIASPKNNKNPFLRVEIPNWRKYKFLKGEAQVFYNNVYTSKIKIDTDVSLDTLGVNLTSKKDVIVKRKEIKKFKKHNTFFKGNVEFFEYEILVKNTKDKKIKIKIIDNIPISSDNKIKVKLQEGLKEITKGFLEWKLELQPNEEKIIKYGFSIEKTQ